MANVFDNIPEVSFIGDLTLAQEQALEIADFQARYKELTGKTLVLSDASPWRLLIMSNAARTYQLAAWTDYQGKMNMLKYAEGDYLDNYAARLGLTRSSGSYATCTVRFTLSAARTSATGIPAGTRVSNATGLYFATDGYAEIPIGSLYADVSCSCTEMGAGANGQEAGELDTLVDLLPYITSVSNVTATTGGSDVETDDDLRMRIYSARAAYNTAGSKAAYKYWALSYATSIQDVLVYRPSAGTVRVYVLLKDGELPDSEFLSGLLEYLDEDAKRPFTDSVETSAPDQSSFDVSLTYYINRSDKASAAAIQAAVAQAVADYVSWQTGAIGRDINPSYLTHLVMAAGAKRVVITSPSYTAIADTAVPVLGNQTVTYGGIEDD